MLGIVITMNYYKNQSGSTFRDCRSWPDNIFGNTILYNTGNYINILSYSLIFEFKKIFKLRGKALAQ